VIIISGYQVVENSSGIGKSCSIDTIGNICRRCRRGDSDLARIDGAGWICYGEGNIDHRLTELHCESAGFSTSVRI
jgi:hypothetical protein